MNPVFVMLVFTAAILLWFLLVFIFKPLGNILVKLWKDAVETINEKDEEEIL